MWKCVYARGCYVRVRYEDIMTRKRMKMGVEERSDVKDWGGGRRRVYAHCPLPILIRPRHRVV